jgi:5-amino-6-(5-phosphoribosylamino)uracil reductase
MADAEHPQGTRALAKPDYTALEFPDPPADRPYVIVNMVSSVDGKTVIEGNERGLGSPIDQRLLRELRLHADVVLNGSGTLRASGSSALLNAPILEALREQRGKPRAPIAAVITASGNVPLDARFFTSREFEAYIYLSDGAPAGRREAIAATGRPVVEVPAGDAAPSMVRHMRSELGARLLLLEGGPTLNGDFFRHGLVDELFLTLGALVVGGHGLITAVETPGHAATRETVVPLELLAAVPNPATSEVYLRYRIRH